MSSSDINKYTNDFAQRADRYQTQLVEEEFAKHFELLPGKSLSEAGQVALQALKNYCISGGGNVPTQLLPVIDRLRDGTVSFTDFSVIKTLVNLSPELMRDAEAGDFSKATSPSLKMHFSLVAAFSNLVREQGVIRTGLETLKDTFAPRPTLPPTKVMAEIAKETGPKYVLRLRQMEMKPIIGGPPRDIAGVLKEIEIDGAGDNARKRAREKLNEMKHFAGIGNLKMGEDFESTVVWELHEKGAPKDAEPLEKWSYDTY